jgi:undecaprenyl-diphosphatase
LLRQSFEWLDLLERPLVRRIVIASQHRVLRSAVKVLNQFGNGWLYPLLVGLLLAIQGRSAARPLLAAACAVGAAHIVYAWLKPRLARVRPCEADTSFPRGEKPLDKFSCPSGHCMTLTAFSLPVTWSFPPMLPVLAACLLAIGWARVSLAHHYPSDLAAGILLALATALPVAFLFL